jgi:uncharacterized protein (TIGR03066 family)
MSSMRSVLSMALVLMLIGCGSPDENKATNKQKIIGAWVVTKSMRSSAPSGNTTWEFPKDGEMIVTEKIDDEPLSFMGKYAVEGDVLTLTTVAMIFIAGNPSKIKKLNDTDLVFEAEMDGKNYTIELKRKK